MVWCLPRAAACNTQNLAPMSIDFNVNLKKVPENNDFCILKCLNKAWYPLPWESVQHYFRVSEFFFFSKQHICHNGGMIGVEQQGQELQAQNIPLNIPLKPFTVSAGIVSSGFKAFVLWNQPNRKLRQEEGLPNGQESSLRGNFYTSHILF